MFHSLKKRIRNENILFGIGIGFTLSWSYYLYRIYKLKKQLSSTTCRLCENNIGILWCKCNNTYNDVLDIDINEEKRIERLEYPYIEICCSDPVSCKNAILGGCNSVELCCNLPEGGTTPSIGFIIQCLEQFNLYNLPNNSDHVQINDNDSYVSPMINILIRPRAGDFLYSNIEFQTMIRDILEIKNLLSHSRYQSRKVGIVIGMLNENGDIDIERMKILIDIAKPLFITFHRAFDQCSNPIENFKKLLTLDIDRLLTSGCENTCIEGIELIKNLIKINKEKIEIIGGGGINITNVNELYNININGIHIGSGVMEEIISPMNYQNNNVSLGSSSKLNNSIDYNQKIVSRGKVVEIMDNKWEYFNNENKNNL